jgi:Flp pilus assembly protein CpaB
MRAAVIGILVAALTSFLVWSYLKRFEEEASGGPRVRVLTVLRTIEAGGILKDGDIGERSVPQAYVDARAIRIGDRQRITNLRVATALDAAQILNWSDLISTSDVRTPSQIVQPPQRAVSVHTEGRSSSLVRPGDRVDVIATLPQPGKPDNRIAVVIMQNILVLGRSFNDGTTTTSSEGTDVALSLSLQQAQLVAVAGEKAKLSLALKAPIDVRIQEDIRDVPSDIIGDHAVKAIAPPPKPMPVPVGGGNR